jgi:predicted Rossmann-fold nucleotide-binding protein
MLDWLEDKVLKNGCIRKEELNIFTVVDSPKEVVSVIKKFYAKTKK